VIQKKGERALESEKDKKNNKILQAYQGEGEEMDVGARLSGSFYTRHAQCVYLL
jgi:hypothetical protein